MSEIIKYETTQQNRSLNNNRLTEIEYDDLIVFVSSVIIKNLSIDTNLQRSLITNVSSTPHSLVFLPILEASVIKLLISKDPILMIRLICIAISLKK